MDKDFLDGIDEQFQRLMQTNGKGNAHALGRSKPDRMISEIIEHLHNLSRSQKEEVLTFIRSMQNQQVE